MTDGDIATGDASQAQQKPRRPWAPEGYLFLQEALVQLGETRFADTWNGKEWDLRRGAGDAPGPPKKTDADQVIRIRQKDGTIRLVSGHVRWQINGRTRILPIEEANETYEKEKDKYLKEWHSRCAAHERFLEAWSELRQALFSKRVSAVAWTDSGGLKSTPENLWSSQQAWRILETGSATFHFGNSYFPGRVNGRILVSESDLIAYLKGEMDQTVESPEESVELPANDAARVTMPKRHAGGRPTKWDWEDCLVEICRIVYLDGLPKTQAEMVKRVEDRFISQFDNCPAESEIKKRVSKVFRAIREAENSEPS